MNYNGPRVTYYLALILGRLAEQFSLVVIRRGVRRHEYAPACTRLYTSFRVCSRRYVLHTVGRSESVGSKRA